ncbi:MULTISPECIES: flagellar protein FlaG [Cytobacillus]|uniref:flagellar protein FlaG n=1 Tax=Cytobacillus TaxID=2675230 RepID=UPI0020410ABF|nr:MULTISPECIES: flagellar protein FlaG [Cytobacillus]MCM3391450.1 flagellar protein FlaG [Cytobacillus oceanisediminis]UQX53833.1 flagellar protein FlaG [Cytobacillus pseudoceanisediminis]
MIDHVSSQNISHTTRTVHTYKDSSEFHRKEGSNEEHIHLKQNEKIKEEKVSEVVESMNEFLQASHTSLKFVLHEELNEYYVTLVDDLTQEVVKEIPSKKMLDMYAAMTDFVGLMVDKKI